MKTRALILLGLAAALATIASAETAPRRLRAVATTTFVYDVVRHVAGDAVDLAPLLPAGVDPHAFEPSPRDAAKLAEADVVFANGAGLETFLDRLLDAARRRDGRGARLVALSDGVPLRARADGHEHGERDPHVWLNPLNVIVWVDAIERKLAELAPAHAGAFAQRAQDYRARLVDLDAWIRETTGRLPPDRRSFVTDHDELGYFADAYGFTIVGAMIPGFSTAAEPSARELADLEGRIRTSGARAVVVGQTANPALARRLARDTGARLVRLYTGSLGAPDGPAATYLACMHHNVVALCDALGGDEP